MNSFGIMNQFLELELSNDLYEEMKFFVDCAMTSSSLEVNSIVTALRNIDEYVSDITLFIPANNKQALSVN